MDTVILAMTLLVVLLVLAARLTRYRRELAHSG